MFNANNNLSLAASEIWASYEERDYDMDGSGECGPMIAKGCQEQRVAIIAEHGFTPKTYNAELRSRLAPEYPQTTYRIHTLLMTLEVEPMDEWLDNNTYVCTLGYPGHPEAEYSSVAYLKGA